MFQPSWQIVFWYNFHQQKKVSPANQKCVPLRNIYLCLQECPLAHKCFSFFACIGNVSRVENQSPAKIFLEENGTDAHPILGRNLASKSFHLTII